MKWARAVVDQVVGLFVADWTQTAGIVLVLVLGYLLVRVVRVPGVAYVVGVALALHLLFTTIAEARRRPRA